MEILDTLNQQIDDLAPYDHEINNLPEAESSGTLALLHSQHQDVVDFETHSTQLNLKIICKDLTQHFPITVYQQKAKLSNIGSYRLLSETCELYLQQNPDMTQFTYEDENSLYFESDDSTPIELIFEVDSELTKTFRLLQVGTEAFLEEYEDFGIIRLISIRSRDYLKDTLRFNQNIYQTKLKKQVTWQLADDSETACNPDQFIRITRKMTMFSVAEDNGGDMEEEQIWEDLERKQVEEKQRDAAEQERIIVEQLKSLQIKEQTDQS
jgi:hypothetical protein